MNLPMNLRDINLWEKKALLGFAIPHKDGQEYHIGDTASIQEPFKRLFVLEPIEKNGISVEKKITAGIIYRSDGMSVWDTSRPFTTFSEAERWSPANQLPDYAIRRKAKIVNFEVKSIKSFTEDEIKLLHLDYASQGNPQILMDEYLPTKNFELLYGWWKQHYKSTLKGGDDPMAVVFHLVSTD